MRKALLAGLLAVWMLTSAALAETYEGTTVAASSIQVEAAAGGILRELTVFHGSTVSEGDALGVVSTTKVFATQDGTVAKIHAAEGESSEEGVLEIYPAEQYQIYCTAEKAYESPETMLVHSGESVYIKCTTDGTHRGTGVITEIDGNEYRVLATGGEFYVGETVYLYRDEEFSTKQRVGIGTVITSETQVYEADGKIVRMHVEEGEYVERGELLYEYADSKETVIYAEADGIITEISVQQGEQISTDDVLLTIVSQDQICVEIRVDEAAAGKINEGDAAEIVFAMDRTETPVKGAVISVSRVAEDGMYEVRIAPERNSDLRLGLSATVWIGED